jgi:hypothetical protein
LVSFDADGFTIDWDDSFPATTNVWVLALKGVGASIQRKDCPASTGTQTFNTNFTVRSAIFFTNINAEDVDSSRANAELFVGASDGSYEFSNGLSDVDALSQTRAFRHQSIAASLLTKSNGNNASHTMTTVSGSGSISGTSVTCDWTETSGAVSYTALLLGDEPVPGSGGPTIWSGCNF